MSNYVVIRSALIETRQEALDYYAARIAGLHTIVCYGRPVRIAFPREGTHMFSEDAAPGTPLAPEDRVVRRVHGGRIEERRFSLDRARLLDLVPVAIERFVVSIPGTGPSGRENRMLHGPALNDGRYLRVVLRPGPGSDWTCVSAYPVSLDVFRSCVRAKRARFPPD